MPTKNVTLTHKQHTDLTSARANLYCVLTQSCDSDDQILMDGVRRALALLDAVAVEAEITDECVTTTDSAEIAAYPGNHVITADEALEAWRQHQSSLHCFGCETVFRFLAQKSAEEQREKDAE